MRSGGTLSLRALVARLLIEMTGSGSPFIQVSGSDPASNDLVKCQKLAFLWDQLLIYVTKIFGLDQGVNELIFGQLTNL